MENSDVELKMWLVVRKDLEIPPGKLAAQAGHGFLSAYLEALTKNIDTNSYITHSQPKIVVSCKNELALSRSFAECVDLKLPCCLVIDEGRTVFFEPTKTVMAVGPCKFDELPKYVQKLQLY